MNLHTHFCKQGGKLRDDLPRIHRGFGGAPEATPQTFGVHCSAPVLNLGRGQPQAVVAELRSDLGEFLEDFSLVIIVGDVQGSGWQIWQARRIQGFPPYFCTAQGDTVHFTNGLPYRPDHAEVPDRGPARLSTPLKKKNFLAGFGQDIRVGKPKNSTPHNRDVGSFPQKAHPHQNRQWTGFR